MSLAVAPSARRLLAATVMAAATLALVPLAAGPIPALASHDGYVDVSTTGNFADSTTGVTTTGGNGLQGVTSDAGASGIYGQNDNHGYGVAGRSMNCTDLNQVCTGVFGESTEVGVRGTGLVGVQGDTGLLETSIGGVSGNSAFGVGVSGYGGDVGVMAIKTMCANFCEPGSAVHAENQEVGGIGVQSVTPDGTGVASFSFEGTGVQGQSTNGTGVLARSFNATALEVDGESEFSRSGRVTIPAGATSVVVPGVALSASSMVLATLQNNRVDTWLRSAVPSTSADTITISLNKQAPLDTKVAWLVIELP